MAAAEPVSGTIYYSRQSLSNAGLHCHTRKDVEYCQQPELHAFSLVSPGAGFSKDMGGLLQQNGSDFLLFQPSQKDPQSVCALQGNQKLSRPVRVIRKVKGHNDITRCPYVFMYCGKYQVEAGWHADCSECVNGTAVWYFKLLRLPDQPPLVPQQVAFPPCATGLAYSVSMTWRAYSATLKQDCSKPCEKINPHNGTGLGAQLDAELDEYDLCDVCGLDGNNIKMQRCGCCQDKGLETVACLSCIPAKELHWVLADQDRRHWRCTECRKADLKPISGKIYEDVRSAQQPQQLQSQIPLPTQNVTSPHISSEPYAQLKAESPRRHKRKKQSQPTKSNVNWSHVAIPAATLQPGVDMPPFQQVLAAAQAQGHPKASDTAPPLVPCFSAPQHATATAATSALQQAAGLPDSVPQAPPQKLPKTALHSPISASGAPATLAELMKAVNSQLKPEHQVTQAQLSQLHDALGDLKTLLELGSLQPDSLNEVLRADGNLQGMQIVAMRRKLKQLRS